MTVSAFPMVRRWFAALLFAGSGCSADLAPRADADLHTAPDATTANSTSCLEDLAQGEWLLIDREDDEADKGKTARWLFCAKSVSRTLLLTELSHQLEFDLAPPFSLAQSESIGGDFSGWIEGDTPELLLQQLFRGMALTFSYQPHGLRHRLVSVSVDVVPEKAVLVDRPSGEADQRSSDDAVLISPAAVPAHDFAAALHARWQLDYGHLEPLLTHPDAAVRMDTIDDIAAEGAGLRVLDRALASERDASVRIALLRKLDESGSVIALQSMVQALSDVDDEVVAESIGMIADWHDVEVVERYVQPLLAHASEDVREAANAAINRFR